MADNPLQHKLRILAGMHNHEDLLSVLEALADSVADVRTPLSGVEKKDDTIATRAACAAILKDAIDTVRRVRKNQMQRPGSGGADQD